jgi:hypothetical protein
MPTKGLEALRANAIMSEMNETEMKCSVAVM